LLSMQDVFAELDDGDPSLGAQAADEAGGGAEALGGLVNGEQHGSLLVVWGSCGSRCFVDPTRSRTCKAGRRPSRSTAGRALSAVPVR